MDDTTYVELIDTLRFYIIGKTIPVETAEQIFDANTDELLAWLPIPGGWSWSLHYGIKCRAQLVTREWKPLIIPTGEGKTLPEAVLRCWLAWKSQETT